MEVEDVKNISALFFFHIPISGILELSNEELISPPTQGTRISSKFGVGKILVFV